MNYERYVVELIQADHLRMSALRAAKSLNLPDWLIAAGFVRNKIWDSLYRTKTALNDVDVIYFCSDDISIERDIAIEQRLRRLEPNIPWSVRNQARMHIRNGDLPYEDTFHAMHYWPEKQTCIGVKLNDEGGVTLRHCFDMGINFNGSINRNPARSVEVFSERISGKGWLEIWPSLQVKA